jgi:hypothetical protein
MRLLQSLESLTWKVSHELIDCIPSLSEPNVLPLDIASHRLNNAQTWAILEEILRIDNIAREKLGFRLKMSKTLKLYLQVENMCRINRIT